MQPVDFFRSRIDAMINLTDPLAVLATRLPWNQIETALAKKFEHETQTDQIIKAQDIDALERECVVAVFQWDGLL